MLGVVVYHLWPAQLPGGYVGVDIFFAISGYLIIGGLIRDTAPDGRIRLAEFWGRRARRLAPASLVVLVVTAATTLFLVPQVVWRQWFQEIGASALYFQNWVLAANSVDYLGADNSASPVQHFWSLSVEEQFYLAWPLLIALVLLLARRQSRRAIGVLLVVVTVLSFVWSVYDVVSGSPAAYFATQGRAWEFGAGGLLAFVVNGPIQRWRVPRAIAGWVGLAGIGFAYGLFNAATPFPGVAALLPVGATLLVIVAGVPRGVLAPSALLNLRPVQWVGGVSYSWYLWHWPPIVILPFVLHTDLHPLVLAAIFVGTLLLAAATKRLVEDPVRRGAWLIARPAPLSIVAALSIGALVFGSGFVVNVQLDRQDAAAATALEAALAATPTATEEPGETSLGCIGAPAALPKSGCENPYAPTELTNPTFAQTDIGKGVQVADQCKQTLTDATVITCDIGDLETATTTLALIGDSHAGQYLEALDLYGRQHHLKFVTYLKTWCAGTSAPGVTPAGSGDPGANDSCASWGLAVLGAVAANPRFDGAVFSNFTVEYTITPAPGGQGRPVAAADFVAAWQTLLTAGKRVIVLRDTPNAGAMNVPQCIAANPGVVDPCTVPRAEALVPDADDPQVVAAKSLPAVDLIDLTSEFCDPTTCHTLIGGLVVYFDSHHMTATFSRTMAPIVGGAIVRVLDARSSE